MATITFIRHGHTEWHEDDLQRVLSARGTEHAVECRVKLGNPSFDLMLVSRAIRTRQTGEIISGSQKIGAEEIHSLLPPPDPDLDALFNKLGYAPLRAYLDADNLGAQKLMYWAQVAASNIRDKVIMRALGLESGRASGGLSILVVGHAVVLPAVGFELCRTVTGDLPDECGEVMLLNLGECEGFQLDCTVVTKRFHDIQVNAFRIIRD